MSTNNYEEYLNKQKQDPEFAAMYELSRKKAKLQFLIEQMKENIENVIDKRELIKELNRMESFVRNINL